MAFETSLSKLHKVSPCCPGEQLLVLIKTLSGGPLYLNKGDIGSLLSKIPEVLFQLNDMVRFSEISKWR